MRFNILNELFYLSQDDCVYNNKDEQLVCGVSDFEVTADKRIYALTNKADSSAATNDEVFTNSAISGYKYTKYNNKNGLTLLRDQPIFIDANNKTSSAYNSE